jgi:putative heme uptake system protein
VARDLFVIDVPNIDMALATLLGCKPARAERPDWRVLNSWFCDGVDADDVTEACAFLNVNANPAAAQRNWVRLLVSWGYFVFAKPRNGDSDVDAEMVDHLRMRSRQSDLRRVIIASHDAKNFVPWIRETQRVPGGQVLDVTVLGFEELLGGFDAVEGVKFVDLEDIHGLWATTLPRIRLNQLPATGAWFPSSPASQSPGESQKAA